MQVTIREATTHDAPAIGHLLEVLMVDHGLAPLPSEHLVQAARAAMQIQGTRYLLAESADALVGMLQLNERYSTWEAAFYGYIEDFCVASELRSRGIGAQLLAYADQIAQRSGWARLDLDVSTSLPASIRFYERAGYRNTGSILYRRELPGE